MQLSFSLLAVATAFAAAPALLLVSAHPAQQLKRVTTTIIKTPTPTPTSTTIALRDAGIPTHASTLTDALPAAIKTTPPSSCGGGGGGSGPPGAAIKGRAVACPNAW